MSDNNNKKAIKFEEVKNALKTMYKGKKKLKDEDITKFFCDCPKYDDKSRDNKCVREIEEEWKIQYVFDFYNEDDGTPTTAITSQKFINPEHITNKTFITNKAVNKLCCDHEDFDKMGNYEVYDINNFDIDSSSIETNDSYLESNPYNYKITVTYSDDGFETPLTIIDGSIHLDKINYITPKYNGLIRKKPTGQGQQKLYPNINIQLKNESEDISSYLYNLNFTFYDNGDENLLDIQHSSGFAPGSFLSGVDATKFLQNVNQLVITGKIKKIRYKINLLATWKNTTYQDFYEPVKGWTNIRWYDTKGKIINNESSKPFHKISGNTLIIAEEEGIGSHDYYFLVDYYTDRYSFNALYRVDLTPIDSSYPQIIIPAPMLRLDSIHGRTVDFCNNLDEKITMFYAPSMGWDSSMLELAANSVGRITGNLDYLQTCLFDNNTILIWDENRQGLYCSVRLGDERVTLVDFVKDGKLNISGKLITGGYRTVDDFITELYSISFRTNRLVFTPKFN